MQRLLDREALQGSPAGVTLRVECGVVQREVGWSCEWPRVSWRGMRVVPLPCVELDVVGSGERCRIE